ncbi:MAG: exopolyphosphatase [Firmicutes bacterium HGW-Firmicutes-15]|nr:MAG: exopolyphosphatase [Firmicutes bacterium HGW-Firmicutes-15]
MSDVKKKFRLVTRSDFDGLVCAVILRELGLIDEIKFVHPKDMQDGKIEITGRDITTNLPYVEGVSLSFDHHESEIIRLNGPRDNNIIDPHAPSAARVVYNYYGGKKALPNISEEMMASVDKADSAQFSLDDVLNPQGWDLLSFVMDARTGLGRFKDFGVSNYELMMNLISYCKSHSIDEILELPDVKDRTNLYNEQQENFKNQIKKCATVYKNLVVLDLRNEDIIYCGNRFMIYVLFPQCNISIHAMWGLNKQNTVFTVGKSIFNKTSQTNIGELMLEYSGGGHANAGTCQIETAKADDVLKEIIAKINSKG